MKPIELNKFEDFKFLSALKLSGKGNEIFFVVTKVDKENNGYLQQLMAMNVRSRKTREVTGWQKRVNCVVLKDGDFLIEHDEKKKNVSIFKKISGKKPETAFEIGLPVERIIDLDDESYIVSTTTNMRCPGYFSLDEEGQKAEDQKVKDNEDYIVFDEYPFVFNGAGVINGNRTSLYLVDKKTQAFKKIVPDTFDVGNFDIIKDKLVFCANDFKTVKTKWDKIYQYDKKKDEIKTLYGETMQLHRVFEENGKLYVKGTFGKDWGEMEAGKFYELKNGKMELRIDTEFSMYNSVGSDSRYGRNKNYDKVNGVNYFITCDKDKSVLLKIENDQLKRVIDIDGCVDDFVVVGDKFFIIGMLGQNLQEICEVKNNKVKVLTDFNKAIFKGYYVAKPEKVTVKKAIDIDGWVLKPINYDKNKKYPAILDIHGGPKTAYGEIYYHEMQHWASKGYFVMFCNPRGSDGKGNLFADLRHQFGGIDYQDIMMFVDLVLEKYPAIDKERLGVTGGSYGGYMTNWIIGQTDRFKAAASQRSISNWITEVGVSDYGIDFPIEQQFGNLYNCADELWGMSPLKFVNRAVTPTLFIHSTEDYRCPVPEALQLYTALTCRGVETRMVLFKGENHELSRGGKPAHRVRRLQEITGWMDKHLNPEG